MIRVIEKNDENSQFAIYLTSENVEKGVLRQLRMGETVFDVWQVNGFGRAKHFVLLTYSSALVSFFALEPINFTNRHSENTNQTLDMTENSPVLLEKGESFVIKHNFLRRF